MANRKFTAAADPGEGVRDAHDASVPAPPVLQPGSELCHACYRFVSGASICAHTATARSRDDVHDLRVMGNQVASDSGSVLRAAAPGMSQIIAITAIL